MAVKYVPYYKEPISGQALLDNFTRTKRTLKYADNEKVIEKIERGLPLYETVVTEVVGQNPDNLVIRGECLSACAYLKENNIKVDLVYIDPPFASGADYAKKIYIRKNPKIAKAIKEADQTLDDEELKSFEEKMYGDIWNKEAYLNWMYENLMAIKSVMSDNASIYVHLDWHIGHYVKILMDEIFGEDNFRNEIIWTFGGKGLSNSKTNFVRNFNAIYYYGLSNDSYLNLRSGNIAKSVIDRFGKYMDENGRIYFRDLENSGEKIELQKAKKAFIKANGKEPTSDDIARDYGTYGSLLKDVWNDIPIVRQNDFYNEYVDYATQKPEKLLERIIKSSSTENMVVADFFGGSGVTAKVANDLNRKFIHVDVGINSIETTRDRLISSKANFKILDIKDGVNLYRNPIQTMEKLNKLIPGLVKDDTIDKFWEGIIFDSVLGKIPVYVPNLMDSSTKILDIVMINKIINQEIIKLDDTIKKVIIYYIDIIDQKEIKDFIKDNLKIDIEIELKDLKEILSETIVDDIIEYHIDSNKLYIDTFISDRLYRKIDEYNEKIKLQTNKKTTNIEISPEGLELIELISLDCTSKKGPWHSDEEIKIDKLGYIINKGVKTDAFFDGTIAFKKKPLRIKVRNISGDESITIIK